MKTNQPATLPWEYIGKTDTRVGEHHYVKAGGWKINGKTAENAAYMAHAANAYPKLVEALADLLRDQLKQVVLDQMAPGPRQRIEKARNLLRDLGE